MGIMRLQGKLHHRNFKFLFAQIEKNLTHKMRKLLKYSHITQHISNDKEV